MSTKMRVVEVYVPATYFFLVVVPKDAACDEIKEQAYQKLLANLFADSSRLDVGERGQIPPHPHDLLQIKSGEIHVATEHESAHDYNVIRVSEEIPLGELNAYLVEEGGRFE